MGRKSLASRFLKKVRRDSATGCLLWIASVDQHGYGQISRGGRGTGMGKAPRVAWILRYGSIPAGLAVLHKCDNPRCVEIDHLFLGTLKDNVQDMIRKGRHRPARGEKNGQAVLSAVLVRELRRLHRENGSGSSQLAKQFQLNRQTVRAVLNGSTWAHVS